MKTNQNYSLRFMIKQSKAKNGKAPIYCRINVNGKIAEISMKRYIESDKWIGKVGMVKGNSEQSRNINTYLSNVANEIDKHYNHLISLNLLITADSIKNSFLGIKEKERTLLEVFKYHNNQVENLIGIDVVKATHTKFETVMKKVKLFILKEYNRTDINLNEINHKFIADFEYYLKVDQKIAHNTTMKYIQCLGKVINMAVSNDWMIKNPFSNFTCTFKKVVREVLSEEEIQILSKKVFFIERLTEVRDIFLFCCYTGYAFADVEKLTYNHITTGIDGEKWIYTYRKKTKIKSNVPLLPPALEIIERYKEHPYCIANKKLLPVKSNQKMNAYLKEVADLCGIHKNLTMHIARHTFATTVTLSNGVPIETVSRLLGHSKLATTQIYAQVLEHKVSEDMGKLKNKLAEKTINITGT